MKYFFLKYAIIHLCKHYDFMSFLLALSSFLTRNFFHNNLIFQRNKHIHLFFFKMHENTKKLSNILSIHSVKSIIAKINLAPSNFLDNIMTASTKLDDWFETLRLWRFQNDPYFPFLIQNCTRNAIYILH